MNRCPDVEQLVVRWMELMKAGDADGVAALFEPGNATLFISNGPAEWYSGGEAATGHFRDVLETYDGIPYEAGAPVAWSDGNVAWFADRVNIAFPQVEIPLRLTGVALEDGGRWRIVQAHLSAPVSDEELLHH